MGMYTEFNLRFEVDSINEDVKEFFRLWVGPKDTVFDGGREIREFASRFDHEFFETERWTYMPNSSSFYFPQVLTSGIHELPEYKLFEVHLVGSMKNYGGEIGKFVDWVSEFVPKHTPFLGYSIYEESDTPNLHYVKGVSPTGIL